MASTPKTMSSRLMTMKFMQRSAAKSSPTASTSTPNSPQTNAHPSKRVRLSNGSAGLPTPAVSEHEAMQAALAAEEKKREEASDRAAARAGETKWVLSFQQPDARKKKAEAALEVQEVGFGGIDGLESEEEENGGGARMRFGGGVKRRAVLVKKEDSEEGEVSESDSDEEGSSSEDSSLDSDDPTAELIRETRRDVYAKEREARRASKEAKKERDAKRRSGVDEDMDVSKLESLSGGAPKSGGKGKQDMACFACGEKGHTRAQCPKNQSLARKPSSGGGGRRGRGGLAGRR